jgi:hypothetical protein
MSLFHRHNWAEVSRTYTPGPGTDNLEKVSGTEGFKLYRELTFGITNVELRCTTCGDVSHRTTIGEVSS